MLSASSATLARMPEPASKASPQSASTSTVAKPRFKLVSKAALVRLAVLFVVIGIALVLFANYATRMPGPRHTGPLLPTTSEQLETAERLRADVVALVEGHPGRSYLAPARYAGSARYLQQRMRTIGLAAELETFATVKRTGTASNIVADVLGTLYPERILIVGAHYDAHLGLPGADDNASGVAGVLELGRRLVAQPAECTVRLVLYANEEPPFNMTTDMGSMVNAQAAADRGDDLIGMISVEMIGYYDTTPGSQSYPPPLSLLYPDTADFIAVVGNVGSRPMVSRAVELFRDAVQFPSEGAAMPAGIPGIGYSDHWSYWQFGHQAIMLTDTSFYRNPHYHTAADTPDTLDYERMARVVDGLEAIVRGLTSDSAASP